MRPSLIIFVLNEAVRGVKVAYEDGKPGYLFKTMDHSIKVDDLVIVQTDTRWGYTVAKVTEVNVEPDLDGQLDVKWIAQKFDAEAFSKLLAVEGEAIDAVNAAEKARKKEELRKSMFTHHEAKMSGLALISLGSETPAPADADGLDYQRQNAPEFKSSRVKANQPPDDIDDRF